VNNGLIAVWSQNNTQGAWDMGLLPVMDGLGEILSKASAVYIMGMDPVGDHPDLVDQIPDGAKLIVQELFHTPTVDVAEVVFPAQSFIEREGTFTSGQRIVQRFFTGVKAFGETLPDWQIAARLGALLGVEMNTTSAAGVMRQLVDEVSDYEGLDHKSISQVKDQWPLVGDRDKYFGGSATKNRQGLGFHLSPATERGEEFSPVWSEPKDELAGEGYLLVPITVLYDHGTTVVPSKVLKPRLAQPNLMLNPVDVKSLNLGEKSKIELRMNGYVTQIAFEICEDVPSGVVLLPRSMGIPVNEPVYVDLQPVE
jgi:NADH-quinone oxidoreductase subunit G